MCELFAISSLHHVRANEQLRRFYRDSVEHPHGWGLSWHDDEGLHLHKEPLRAIDSAYLSSLLERPIVACDVVGHIRNATMGTLSYDNCHPFVLSDPTGRQWVIAHNGTILDDHLTCGYKDLASGDTDSEQAALYLVDRMNDAMEQKGGELSFDERFAVLERAITELAPSNKLNLVMDDGEYIYAHTNTVEPTLYESASDGIVTLCTRPQDDSGSWREVPQNRLIAYRDGLVARMGARHGFSMDEAAYFRAIMELNAKA